jgi:MFS transporter, DHA1 family, arabinose polymer utilization protein
MSPDGYSNAVKPVRYPLSLALGGVAIGVAEFLPVGLLPDIGQSLQVSIPEAGHLLSAYAVGVVVGAPLLVAVGLRFPPKRVLIAFMSLFGLFNALFAAIPTYPLLIAVRFLSGLPHGAFFGLGAVIAARLAPRGRQAGAVAIMFAGLTLANILLVPLGTYLGHHWSWRIPFVAVSLLAFGAAWAIRWQIPEVASVPERGGLANLRHVLHPKAWPLIGISAIGTGGLYAWISYIAPLVTQVTGVAPDRVGIVMILAGVGMAVGNWIGGHLADRFAALRVVRGVLVAMIASVLLVALLASYPAATYVMTFVTGAVAFSVIAPLQMLMLEQTPGSKTMASAFMQSTSNIGNALGAYLGGLGISLGYGYLAPEVIGAMMVGFGLLCAMCIRAGEESVAVALAR